MPTPELKCRHCGHTQGVDPAYYPLNPGNEWLCHSCCLLNVHRGDPIHGYGHPDVQVVSLAVATKDTNPKDIIGDKKVPLWLLSTTAKIQWALAQFAGMLKYGSWNWRAMGVRCSVYLSAMERHMEAYKNGERLDPTDRTHHLGNIMACCAILLDAEESGKLVDDRPYRLNHRPTLAEAEATMGFLRDKYKEENPKHYTIEDSGNA
jgi:hypothetical protein